MTIEKKLPFEYTPQIKRLLREIFGYTQDWIMRLKDEKPMFLLHCTEEERKELTEKEMLSFHLFFEYLQKNKIIEVLEGSKKRFLAEFRSEPETPYSRFFFNKQMALDRQRLLSYEFLDEERFDFYIWTITIKNSSKIAQLKDLLIKDELGKTEKELKFIKTKIENKDTLITRNGNGDFYYKNKPIKFDNKETIYYLIFECLYERGDLEGFCSYENINKYLIEYGKIEYSDNRKIIDRIKNGIQCLFRFTDLSERTPDNKSLIKKVKGKGMILYNPKL